ncbi:MBL fold metallo-hydrolase [Planctomycetota bacterium]
MIQIETFALGELFTNCFLVWDDSTLAGAIIDPGGDPASVIEFCADNSIEPAVILATHGHFDHIGGVGILKNTWDIPYGISSLDEIHYGNMNVQAQIFGCTSLPEPPLPDIDLSEKIEAGGGGLSFEVVLTPGHSEGSVSFIMDDNIFCGDLIFQGSIGRTDFPGGDMESLLTSVRDFIFPVESGRLFPGHGPMTDVCTEKMYNPFFQE